MRFLILAAACAAVMAGPASAKDKKPEDPEKKICKFEAQSSSRLPKKICKTAAEWKALQTADPQGVDDTYRRLPSSH